MAKTLHPSLAARAAETKKVYSEKRSDPSFMAKSPRDRIGIVSREVSARVGKK